MLASSYGSRITCDPHQVERALTAAAKSRDGPPSFILILGSPGDEEEVVSVTSTLLPGVPILGGSSADNAVAGNWRQVWGGWGFSSTHTELY